MAQWQIARFRRLLAGQCDNRADLLRRERRRRARTWRISQPLSDWRGLGRAAPAMQPMAHGLGPNAELAGGFANSGPCRGQQDHLGTFRQLLWRGVRSDQAEQHRLMRRAYRDRIGRQTWHRRLSESRGEQVIRHAMLRHA